MCATKPMGLFSWSARCSWHSTHCSSSCVSVDDSNCARCVLARVAMLESRSSLPDVLLAAVPELALVASLSRLASAAVSRNCFCFLANCCMMACCLCRAASRRWRACSLRRACSSASLSPAVSSSSLEDVRQRFVTSDAI